jgi:hypothetical protein
MVNILHQIGFSAADLQGRCAGGPGPFCRPPGGQLCAQLGDRGRYRQRIPRPEVPGMDAEGHPRHYPQQKAQFRAPGAVQGAKKVPAGLLHPFPLRGVLSRTQNPQP